MGSQALGTALKCLRSKALFESRKCRVFTRVGGTKKAIYIDSGNKRWWAIKITAEGWKIVKQPKARFERPKNIR